METSPGSPNMKNDPTPSVPPETGQGEQNMKTGLDDFATAKNEFGNAKHENEI
jgi:hypothetical protein